MFFKIKEINFLNISLIYKNALGIGTRPRPKHRVQVPEGSEQCPFPCLVHKLQSPHKICFFLDSFLIGVCTLYILLFLRCLSLIQFLTSMQAKTLMEEPFKMDCGDSYQYRYFFFFTGDQNYIGLKFEDQNNTMIKVQGLKWYLFTFTYPSQHVSRGVPHGITLNLKTQYIDRKTKMI